MHLDIDQFYLSLLSGVSGFLPVGFMMVAGVLFVMGGVEAEEKGKFNRKLGMGIACVLLMILLIIVDQALRQAGGFTAL